jgi:S1-C subfamily serine protease
VAAFEESLKADAEFAREVGEYKETIVALEAYVREVAFRGKLAGIRKNVQSVPMAPVRPQGRSIRFLPQVMATAAVAASLALVVMLLAGNWIIGTHNNEDQFVDLNNEMSQMKETIDSLLVAQYPEVEKLDVSFGTALPVSSNGYLLTSYHTVRDAERIFVELPGVSRFRVHVVYADPDKDLAVLHTVDTNFSTFGKLPYTFAGKTSRLGEYVYTLGYSKRDIVFTEGSVSSITGFEEDTFAYQVSVPANPGNSGGPIVNSNGEVVGLLSGKHSEQEGAAFATKSGYILDFLEEMKSDTSFADLTLPKGSLKYNTRPDQVEKLKSVVYKVRVYSK